MVNDVGVQNKFESNTCLRVVEELVDVLDSVDCRVYPSDNMTATNKSDNNEEEVISNGTPERVQQNPLGKLADAISSVSSTYSSTLMDSLGIKDSSSSKNLRVLWSRAYLNHVGKMVDLIAYQLIPKRTQDVIKLLPMMVPLVDFQEFITSRTVFIDGVVDSFLRGVDEIETTTTAKPQIVLFGAGYDTRSLRCNGRATFFDVDLPDAEGKGRLQQWFWKDMEDK
jgi:hypothetical protein